MRVGHNYYSNTIDYEKGVQPFFLLVHILVTAK